MLSPLRCEGVLHLISKFLRKPYLVIRNIVGGRSGSYEDELIKARSQAMQEMADRAARMGADAVVGIDIRLRGSRGTRRDADGDRLGNGRKT